MQRKVRSANLCGSLEKTFMKYFGLRKNFHEVFWGTLGSCKSSMARNVQSALPARRVFSTVGIPVEHVVTVVAEILSYKTYEDMDYRKSKFVAVKLFWSRLQTLYIGSVNSERFEGIDYVAHTFWAALLLTTTVFPRMRGTTLARTINLTR